MEIQTRSVPAQKNSTRSKSIEVGDRVTFTGVVLRVLEGEDRPLLILINGNGVKLRIASRWFKNGVKLKGSDPVALTGTVVAVGQSSNPDAVPVSMAVEGYSLARVTLGAKHVRRTEK